MLISEDQKSAEIIKPFLAGRDIKRYQTPESGKYLIFTRRGIEIDNYPAIKRHLEQYKERLKPKPKNWSGEKWNGRKSGPYKWYEKAILEYQKVVEKYPKGNKVQASLLKQGFSFFEVLDKTHNLLQLTFVAVQLF